MYTSLFLIKQFLKSLFDQLQQYKRNYFFFPLIAKVAFSYNEINELI